jgi:hypothetical protein
MTHLGDKALEEAGEPLLAGHVAQDAKAALGVVEVAVLNARLDDVERSRHDERSRSAGNGSNKVLEPRRLIVILQVEQVLLGERGTSEKLVRESESSSPVEQPCRRK